MMKKLLFTLTTALLFNFANSGYAAPDTCGLNDLPDEIKLHIALQLSTDDQKNLGMSNKSFNAIMADDTVLIRQTFQKFGLDFDHIGHFGKKFIEDVLEGNFAIRVDNFHKGFLNKMMYIDRASNMTSHSLDNNGHINVVESMLPPYRYLQNDHSINLNATNHDGSTFASDHRVLRSQIPEDSREYDVERKWQFIAAKYVIATNERVDLFPADNGFNSYGDGLNSNGSIIVGEINDNKKVYGFVHNDDGNTIFLKNPQQASSNRPKAVSDQGEVVAGHVMKNGKSYAAIWLHNADNNEYHPCLLQDLIMQNCSDAQRQLLQDNYCTHFDDILAVSPNGKAMFVKTSHPGGNNFKIVFGSKIVPVAQDITVPQY